MSNVWQELSIFESTEIVRKLYKRQHGRELNAEKSREIVSHLAQGREYFASSREAANLVRPLLLYYGVLSLSRGLILFKTGKREAALSQRHGFEVGSWRNELGKTGIRAIPELQITFQEGTFSELCEVTGNIERPTIGDYPLGSKTTLHVAEPAVLPQARLVLSK